VVCPPQGGQELRQKRFGQTLIAARFYRHVENPERCSRPGFLSWSLILGKPTALGCHRGMGYRKRSARKPDGRGLVGGWGAERLA
jgi:hypothetical protein